MNVREIKLVNSEGQMYTLTMQEHFIHSIGGFGFTDQTAFQRVGSMLKPLTELMMMQSFSVFSYLSFFSAFFNAGNAHPRCR